MASNFLLELDTTPPTVSIGPYGVDSSNVFSVAYTVDEPGVASARLEKGVNIHDLDIGSAVLSTSSLTGISGDVVLRVNTLDEVGNEREQTFDINIATKINRDLAMPTGGVIVSNNRDGSVHERNLGGEPMLLSSGGLVAVNNKSGIIREHDRGGMVLAKDRSGVLMIHDTSGEVKPNKRGGEPR